MVKDCKIGKDVKIIEPVNLYGCILEDGAFVGPFCEIQCGVKIGKNTRISSHSFICTGVTIGDDCFIGHGVMFINDLYKDSENYEDFRDNALYLTKLTIIDNNVRIGSNATILPVRIGDNVIIGAGSVVTKDIKKDRIVCGNPAQVMKNGKK